MLSTILCATPDLNKSIEFYKRLGFEYHQINEMHMVWDGKALIEIDPKRHIRNGIRLYKDSWEKEIAQLNTVTNITSIDGGFLLTDKAGSWIHLLEKDPGFSFTPLEECFSVLGNYAGISLESSSLSHHYQIYQILGFEITMGAPTQSWMVCGDNFGMSISLMEIGACPHLFFNPSLTYFNSGKNLENIAKIKSLRIPVTEEITAFNKEGIVDNIIIRDPGGFGFFVFND